jgi:alkylation response protein AidB-like acyl-CoA dehydrogenase
MSFLDRFRPGGAGDHVIVRGPRQRRKLTAAIADRIVDLEISHAPVAEIQPLVQIVAEPSYPAWRDAWEASWRKKQAGYSTAAWPERIGPQELAALLVPVMAGRVGTALGKHPRPVAEPAFLVGTVPADAGPDDPALAVCAHWLTHIAAPGVICAPPVIETIVSARLQRRWVSDFGVAWSLPAPDGV